MLKRFRVVSSMVVLLALVVLAACGGSASASPVERAENFFNDFNSALKDDLSKPENQEKWATQLSEYFDPSVQSSQKADIKQSFEQMAAFGAVMEVVDVKFEEVSNSGDVAEIKIVSGKMIATILGQKQEENLADANFGENGTAKMNKIDGVWYFETDIMSNN